MMISAFVPEPAVEAFHMAVLHWLAWLNVQQRDLLLFAPNQKMPARELWSVIAANRLWLAALIDHPIERARHSMTGQACVDLDDRTFPRVAIYYCQHPQTSSRGQPIGHEIDRPLLVGSVQQRVFGRRSNQPFPLQPPDS